MTTPSRDGEILEGKYRLVRKLGEGAMGAVYAGENLRVKRMVAIKILHAAASAIREMTERFEREAQAAGQIGNDHITEVYDLGTTAAGERYMVLEYLEGETLRARIKRKKRLEPGVASQLIGELLEGLDAAHRAGIIHRDVKPDNVFVVSSKAGRRDFVKILDFGISKFTQQGGEEGSATRTGTVMGSPNYMSPEHVRGTHEVDARSDLYSVGVMLYEALTGALPRTAKNFAELLFKVAYEPMPDPRQLVPTLPEALVAVIMRACATDPAQRFQSAAEFAQALAAAAPPELTGEVTGVGMSVAAASWGQRSQPAFGSASQPSHPGMTSQPGMAAQPGMASQPGFAASASQPSFSGSASQPGFLGSSSTPGFAAGAPGQAERSQPDPNGTAILALSGSSPSWRGDASAPLPAAGPLAAGDASVPSFSQHGTATAAGVSLQRPASPEPTSRRRPLMIAMSIGAVVGVAGIGFYALLGSGSGPGASAADAKREAERAPSAVPAEAKPAATSTSSGEPVGVAQSADATSAAVSAAVSAQASAGPSATAKPVVKPRVGGPKPKGPDPGY